MFVLFPEQSRAGFCMPRHGVLLRGRWSSWSSRSNHWPKLENTLHVQLEMEVRTYPWSKLINTGQGLSLPIVVLALVCPPRWSDKLGEKRVESLPGGKFLLQWNHSFSQLCPYPAWDPVTILILLVPCFSGLIA